jgi:hypothetical protein
MVSPRALASLRLMTSSNFVGCSMADGGIGALQDLHHERSRLAEVLPQGWDHTPSSPRRPRILGQETALGFALLLQIRRSGSRVPAACRRVASCRRSAERRL